jgi:hypothetical protein
MKNTAKWEFMSESELLMDFKNEFFMKDIDKKHAYNQGYNHPYIIKIDDKDVGCIALEPIGNFDNPKIHIVYFYIYEKRKGDGSFILKRLCDLADKYGVILHLNPIPQKPTKEKLTKKSISELKKKLIFWYQRFGFNVVAEEIYGLPCYYGTRI